MSDIKTTGARRGPKPIPVALRFGKYFSIDPASGCYVWTGAIYPNGYGQISVNRRMQLAHRVSWEMANGPIPEGQFVCHRCDTRACVNPDHLFIGTRRENVDDMLAKGRQGHGESHGNAVLTDDIVRRVRAAKGPQVDIAKQFNISKQQVSRIIRGDRWAHV